MKKLEGKYHKTLYCSEFGNCGDGERVFEIFLLAEVRYCSNDRGVRWLQLRLEDKTGSISAKVWSDNIQMDMTGLAGQIVYVAGNVTFYNGKPDLSIEKMQQAPISEIEITEIVRVLPEKKALLYQTQIERLIGSVSSEELRGFLKIVLSGEKLAEAGRMPVRLKGNHSYRGGLLAHLCEVAVSAVSQAEKTKTFREIELDKDIVIAGALIHDVGSFYQVARKGYSFEQKDNGLLGQGYVLYKELLKAKTKSGISDTTFAYLMHIVDVCCGNSAPATMEAMAVQKADQLSEELELYEQAVATAKVTGSETEGSLYSRELKRKIWMGGKTNYDR